MKIKNYIFSGLIIVNVMIVNVSFGQDFNEDYQNAMAQIIQQPAFKLALTIDTESGNNALSDFQITKNYLLYKTDDSYYYDMEDVEMIIESDAHLTIDHEAKMILIKFGDFQSIFNHYNQLSIPENLNTEGDDSKFLGESASGIRSYEFEINDEQFQKVLISFDKHDGFIHEITYVYADNTAWHTNQVSVSYDLMLNFDNKVIPAITSFVDIKNEGWQTTSAYANYSLKIIEN